MSRWFTSSTGPDRPPSPAHGADKGAEDSRIARAAVALLRGDVAVLQTGSRIVMAAAAGVGADESARTLAEPLQALAKGYRAQLSVPIWRGDRRIGVLAVLGRSSRRFNDAEVALLRALAACVDRTSCSLH